MISLLLLLAPLHAQTDAQACQKEILQIDKQIESLAKERDAHYAKAAEYQKEGDNWQFTTGQFADARKNWDKASAERIQGQQIEGQIQTLEQRKQSILQFYPELNTP